MKALEKKSRVETFFFSHCTGCLFYCRLSVKIFSSYTDYYLKHNFKFKLQGIKNYLSPASYAGHGTQEMTSLHIAQTLLVFWIKPISLMFPLPLHLGQPSETQTNLTCQHFQETKVYIYPQSLLHNLKSKKI